MNAIKLFILIFAAFCSCHLRNESENNGLNPKVEESSNNISELKQLDYYIEGDSITTIDGHPQLSYRFIVDSTGNILKSIFIYKELVKVQEVIANKSIERKDFQLADWNFDGYKDISVLYNCASGGCAYWIWNYSPTNGKYYYNEELSELLGLEIDTASQFIVFHYRAGFSEEKWDSLQYVNGKLTLVNGLYQEKFNDSLGNSWIRRTQTKMISGKPVLAFDSLPSGADKTDKSSYFR